MKLKTLLLLSIYLLTSFSSKADNNPLWMRYSKISPDGNQIAFCYQGDIYKVASQGGVAIQLTSNESYDYTPIWSPDSKNIAFASDRKGNFDIYIMSAQGGKAKRLTTNSAKETPSSFSADGKHILFSAHIMDDVQNAMFPKSYLSELYSVSIDAKRPIQVLTTPAEKAVYSKDGKQILYMDRPAGENIWRKHHTSSVTRDIWIYNTKDNSHTQLTHFKGEDRDPIFSSDEENIFFLSEKSGSFNIWNLDTESKKLEQLTFYKNNPVRFLSKSDASTLCYGYRGEIYTQEKGEKAKKVNISIINDNTMSVEKYMNTSSGARQMSVSPNGKEIAFVMRGDVYVTSVDYKTTKQITQTPEQERSVSFSPDGKAILYAGERNKSWNLYQTKKLKEEEKYFFNSTLLKEEVILESDEETFQAKYSPDGKEIAFRANRTEIRVINLKSKKTRVILDGKWNYSYTDNDLSYSWSPDSKWFVVDYNAKTRWPNSDIGLIDAQGKKIINLSNSGYIDSNPKWGMNGNAIYWTTDRNGMRSHGSWGSLEDVYAMFLNQESFDKFILNKEEAELAKEENKKSDEDKKKSKDKKESKIKDINIEIVDIEDRIVRLTINSSRISNAILTKDGTKLYYLSSLGANYDLWVHDFKESNTKKIVKLSGYNYNMQMSKDGKSLFFSSGSSIKKINIANNKVSTIKYSSEMYLNKFLEREYLFEHVWRQTREKFYKKDMHGIDWDEYKKEYIRFLPYINNNYDFSELLSEMLGELNASHTGSGYRSRIANGDRTANLGVFYDNRYTKDGLKIAEIIDKSPLKKAKSKARKGCIIEKIDGIAIKANEDYYPLLNHKSGKKVLLSLYNPNTKERWEESIKAISSWKLSDLLYQRWIKFCRAETERLSDGKLAYVHIKGMNDASFRNVYSEVMGRYYDKDAVIIDTRYNGGGHLHEDIEVLFSV